MTLLYWEWHLIPRRLLRNIFVLFPEQLLNGLVSWGSPGKYSMIDYFLGDALAVLFCPFWNSAVVMSCSAANTQFKLLDHIVSASFLTGGVFECDLAHSWSVAVLCMLYKIRCDPLHPLYDALPVPYVPLWVTRGTVIAHRYTYPPPRSQTWQYSRTFIPLSVSLWNDLSDPVFDSVGLVGLKSRANAFL